MHTTTNPAISLPILVDHGSWRVLRRVALASAIALLGACGGGGGGGGGSNTANTNSYNDTTSPWVFPMGTAVAPPGALASTSSVIGGGQGISGTGASMSMTTRQAVLSSQADAMAAGRINPAGSGLIDPSALFDTSARGHAACYGPNVAYTNHDDAPGTNGSLPAGELAIWSAEDHSAGTQPCATAELAAQTQGLSAQVHQALLLLAALRRHAAADSSQALPTAGSSISLLTRANTLLTPLLGGATVQAASMALNADSSEYTYRLLLTRGSGATAQTLEISMLHTPAQSDTIYAGTLRMALSYLSTDASIGCTDQMDGAGRFKVARLISLGYNRQDQLQSLRLRAGQYCGNASGTIDQFGELAAQVMSGELNPAVFVNGSTRGSTLGWRQGFVRLGIDLHMSTQSSDFAYAWQDKPLGGISHARLFLGHGTLDTGTSSRTLAVFHGYTDDITKAETTESADGIMLGMICNWSGPGSTRTLQSAYQRQVLSLGANALSWSTDAAHSQIEYAPTNSCHASTAMSFDADGNGTLAASEGAGPHKLVVPGSASLDVHDDILGQGYLAPILGF